MKKITLNYQDKCDAVMTEYISSGARIAVKKGLTRERIAKSLLMFTLIWLELDDKPIKDEVKLGNKMIDIFYNDNGDVSWLNFNLINK